MSIVEAVIVGFEVYLATGLLFGIAFVSAGVQRIDHVAGNSGLGFRLIILPGVAALWPWLLMRWIRADRRRA